MKGPVIEKHLSEMADHAASEYPFECCGIVTLTLGKAELHRCTNIYNELHENDPKAYPRDARSAYYIDPGQLRAIMEKMEDEGGQITCFYHSHPDTESYFSQEDEDRALFWGEPLYPDAVHCVVSVQEGVARYAKLFGWDVSSGRYLELSEKLFTGE